MDDIGYTILGIAVFVVFGGLIGWVIWRHIKYTVAGTKAQARVLKQAVGQAKEEIKVANERKKAGLGWTLPPEAIEERRAAMGKEEIVFTSGAGPANGPQFVPEGEIVFGYTEEQEHSERKDSAKNNFKGAAVVLVITGLIVLAGVLINNNVLKIATYPTAQAKVLRSVEVLDEDDEYIDHYNVDFEYTVDGETYKRTGAHSEALLKGVITVHYQPGNPGRAYLESEAQGEDTWFYYAAGIFGCIGLLLLGAGLNERRKLTKQETR